MSLRLAFARTDCTPMTHCVPMGWNSWNFWVFRADIFFGSAWWWRLMDSNHRPPACEARLKHSGARRTGRKPCTARLSICRGVSLHFLFPCQHAYILLNCILYKAILFVNFNGQYWTFTIFLHLQSSWKNFYHPEAFLNIFHHLCIIPAWKIRPGKSKRSAVMW